MLYEENNSLYLKVFKLLLFLWYNVVHVMYGINNVGHIHKWTVQERIQDFKLGRGCT